MNSPVIQTRDEKALIFSACDAFRVRLRVLASVILRALAVLVAGDFIAVLPVGSRRLADVHSRLLKAF